MVHLQDIILSENKFSDKPPKFMQENAKRGLELRRESKSATDVGIARARDLSNGKSVSLKTLKRMNSFFARHLSQWKKEGSPKEGNRYIALLLWGGTDNAHKWVERQIKKLEK